MKIVFDDDRKDIVIGSKKNDKKIKTSKPAKGKPKGSAGKLKKSNKNSK